MKLYLSAFEIFALWWIEFILFALILALFGLFHLWILIVFLLLQIAAFIFVYNKMIKVRRLRLIEYWVIIILFFIGVFLSLNTNPTIFGGRDEGSLMTAGIYLAEDHSLFHRSSVISEFGYIYGGEGKALNFPGFYYESPNAVRTQFLPGFPVWIAVIYSFFGFTALKFVNLIPFIIFGFTFFKIIELIFKNKNKNLALTAVLLLISFTPIIIFYKFALTEIFFAAILWFFIFQLIKYFKNSTKGRFITFLYPFLLMPFIRIESVLIAIGLLFILYFFDRKNFIQKKYFYGIIVATFFFLFSLIVNFNFFFDTLKGALEIKNNTEQSSDPLLGEEGFSFLPDDWENFYLGKVLLNYLMLPFIILGLFKVLKVCKNVVKGYKKSKKEITLKSYLKNLNPNTIQRAIPFLVTVLIFVYLIDPNISDDHPWMLRRFVFAILPVSILYTFMLFKRKKSLRMTLIFIISITIGYNLYINRAFLIFQQNEGLLEDVSKIQAKFKDDDLILIAQNSSGSGWSLISEPLRTIYDKQAVYFFNPKDLDKINFNNYNNVYLLASKEDEKLFSKVNKTKVDDYKIDYSIVEPSKRAFSQPGIEKVNINGRIYKIQKEE